MKIKAISSSFVTITKQTKNPLYQYQCLVGILCNRTLKKSTFGFLICSYCGSNISGHCPVPQLDCTFIKLQHKLETVHFIMYFQENEWVEDGHSSFNSWIYLWIWIFGTILQTTYFGEELFNHFFTICRLFLQQVPCESFGEKSEWSTLTFWLRSSHPTVGQQRWSKQTLSFH